MKMVHLETVDSTNTYAKKMIRDEDRTLVVADRQTAGRGRLGRDFYSPKDSGLYMSIVFSHKNSKLFVPALYTVAAAVAVCHILEKKFNVQTGVKWVNDIYADGRKVCGILTEGCVDAGGLAVVVGIGVNLFTADFPEQIKDRAGSVSNTPVSSEERMQLAQLIAEEFFRLTESPWQDVILEYKSKSFLIGKTVTVSPIIDNHQKDYTAVVTDISPEAKLVVKTNSGTTLYLDSGEVTLHR